MIYIFSLIMHTTDVKNHALVGLNVKILSQQKKIFQENKNHIKNFI